MLGIKARIALVIFMSTYGFSLSAYVGAEELNSLTDQGKSTCGFSNMGLGHRGRARKLHPESEFCHASLISKTQVLITDSRCWEKRHAKSQQKRLSCHGARQLYELPSSSEAKKLPSGQTLVELPSPLPYSPHQLSKDSSQRQELFSHHKELCQVESPYQTLPLTEFTSRMPELNSTQLTAPENSSILKNGAHIVCEDEQGQSLLVGQIDSEGFLWPKLNQEWPDEFFKSDQDLKHRELNELERVRLLCQQNAECLESIGDAPLGLTQELSSIVEALNQEYQNKNLERSHQELKTEFQKLLLQCQDVAWEIQRSEDSRADSNMTSGVVGSFESFSLNIAETVSNDFLVNQFMGIDLISSELSFDQVKKIVRQQATQADEEELGTMQRIARTALELSRKVVTNMLLEMNPELSSFEQEQIWQELSLDLQACLDQAKSVSMIQECSEKFSLTAPTLIADKELERQLELNFKQRNSDQDYEEIKTQSQIDYRRCLQDFYYPERDNELLGHAERIKACVYEGLLSGYKLTAKAQIKEGLLETTDDPEVIESIQLSALENSQECDYGRLFHRQEQRTQQDYDTLARLDIADFQTALEECSKGLTQVAGEEVIKETISRNPEVQENLDAEERLELNEKVIREYYRPCISMQEEPDPKKCESMITELTTLQVAMPIMFQAIDEQMSQLNSDPNEALAQGDQMKVLVQREMDACHDDLKSQHLEGLNSGSEVSKTQVLNCLEQGIRLVAKGSAEQVIKDSILNNPQTSSFSDKILSDPQIQQLPEQTADCFGQRVRALQSAEELAQELPEISEDCALQTQKSATLLSLSPILDESLVSNIPNENKREAFIQNILNGDDGLSSQVQSAQNQEELDAILEKLPAQVAMRYAHSSVPELVERYLEGMTTPEKRNDISNQIVNNLEECLDSREGANQDLDTCINQATELGHLVILEEIVHFNALENLQNNEMIASRLVQDSQSRLKDCLEEIPKDIDSDDFNQRLESCVTQEVGLISRDIPREVILSLSPLMKSQYQEKELREQMKKVEDFYLSEGDLEGIDDRDPAVLAYMSLNTCVTSTRSDIRRSDAGIEQAQRMYEECTSKVTDSITGAIKRGFISGNYEGKNRSHYEALDMASDILLELTGKSTSTQESSDENPNDDVLELLELVGQNTVSACNYHAQRCEEELQKTQEEITRFKRENPNASSEELQEKFINSSFMKLIIEANIAQSMQEELGSALSEFEDSEGLLKKQIEKITSPDVMNRVLSNRYGTAVSELVTRAIQNGEIDEVVEDPSTRSALGLALIENTEDNSFTDQLLFGLVQPQLNQQRESSSGIGGIFNNTKVAFGRLFGVVQGRDFDWNRVRQTPQGRQAREIFAQEILLPVLQGEDLSRAAANNSQKSLQDVRLERIQSLIEEGIKDLSQ